MLQQVGVMIVEVICQSFADEAQCLLPVKPENGVLESPALSEMKSR